MEDLCAQRVDVGAPPLPSIAFGHMDDVRQPGKRRMVVPGHDEGAAQNDCLCTIAATTDFVPRRRRHGEPDPDCVGPRTAPTECRT